MTVNIWGTPIDTKTGLPIYPVQTASTQSRLKKQAQDAAYLADRLQAMLDEATTEFEAAFAEADRLTATRQRIAAAAKNN